jgi:hypothetical protein
MTKGTKIILAISGVLAIGAGIFIYTSSKKKKEEEEARIAAEALAKAQAGKDSNGGGSAGKDSKGGGSKDGGSSSVSTGFKNKAEGDAFRGWVNNKYPVYAKSIVLSKTGDYDNSYIRKAYAKYGAEYKLSYIKPHLLAKRYLGTNGKIVGSSTVVSFKENPYAEYEATFYDNNYFNITKKNQVSGKKDFYNGGEFLYGGRVLTVKHNINKGKKFYASNKSDGSVLSNLISAVKKV